MKAFLSAFQFLTIVPVRISGELTPQDLGRSVAWYPFVGALQGIVIATMGLLLAQLLPPGVTACLFVLLLVLASGGFHQDGLADTLDALAARAHGPLEEAMTRRLGIMKGSTTGPMGVSGIVLTILVKIFSVMVVFEHAVALPGLALAALAAVPVLGKWSMVSPLVFGHPARPDGIGRLVMTHAGPEELLGALGTTVVFLLLVAFLLVPSGFRAGYLVVGLTVMISVLLFASLVRRLATSFFGGLTGDVFGFINEVSEMFYLVVVTGWLR